MKTILTRLYIIAVVVVVLAVPLVADSGDVIVTHYNAAFCQQMSAIGLPGPCQQNVMVMTVNQDASRIDSVKIVLTFKYAGVTAQKTELAEVNSFGVAVASFPISDIEIVSVAVTPLMVAGESTTVTPTSN